MANRTACLGFVGLILALSACSSNKPQGTMGIASQYPMTESSADSGTMVYKAPNLDVGKYKGGFYIDSPDIYTGGDTDFGNLTLAEKQQLAATLKTEFTRALSEKYKIAAAPGPGVVRLHLTLTGVKGSRPVLSTAMRLTPIGFGMTLGRQVAGMPGAFTGSVSFAGELADSQTGQELAAFLTTQSPPALDLTSGLGELRAAELGIGQGADSFRAAVDRLTGKR